MFLLALIMKCFVYYLVMESTVIQGPLGTLQVAFKAKSALNPIIQPLVSVWKKSIELERVE